ncbi:MAG: hypothetical protein AMS17_20450 [Spirochaetes bacterium DG_61]|nr:MAG: hypothetical protein AMS17_20450 [Spirochaetes bacterium DG_61]
MYTDATLTVHVTNTHSDAPVPEIPDLHVYLYDSNGNYVSVSVSDENSDAFFNMLQPGTYNAIANYYEQVVKVDNIVVSATDVAVELQFNVPPPWYIQTLPNDSVGDLLELYDWVILDTLEYPLISGQTYYIEITGYLDYTGHYGLYVSKTLKDPQSVAGADPLTNGVNDQYEPNDTLPEATSISTDTGYNAYLAANDADVFVITIP